VVSLLFVVVLASDLLLPGIGGLASAPEPTELSKEIPQIALEAAPADEYFAIEGHVAPSPTSAPMAAEAPPEEPELAVEEEENARSAGEVAASPTSAPTPAVEAAREEQDRAVEEEEKAAEGITADQALPETGTPPAPMGGGAATEEAAALVAPTAELMVAPTVVLGAALTPTIPAEAPTVSEAPPEGEVGLLEPSPREDEAAPPPIWAEERGPRGPGRGRLPWAELEVGLGLAVVVLTFTTIRAWRVRRR
jgi:hypothetical protein